MPEACFIKDLLDCASKRRRGAWVLFWLAAGLVPSVPYAIRHQPFTASTLFYGPQGDLRYALPEIAWQIRGPASSRVTKTTFRLNDESLEADYIEATGTFRYQPKEPLAPGTYSVACEIVFDRRFVLKRNWVFRVREDATRQFPMPGKPQLAALEEANRIRKNLGLDPIKLDPRLSAAATAHNAYMAANMQLTHTQDPQSTEFLAESVMQRVAAFGWGTGVFENVTRGLRTPEEGIAEMFAGPYHRKGFLQPGLIRAGYSFGEEFQTLILERSLPTGTVASPGDGQTNVPRAWLGREDPDPLRMHPGSKEVGYPIMLAHFDRGIVPIRLLSASLSARGANVEVWVNHPGNDDQLRNAVVLFARSVLQPKTAYTVRIAFETESGQKIERTWTFTTGTNL